MILASAANSDIRPVRSLVCQMQCPSTHATITVQLLLCELRAIHSNQTVVFARDSSDIVVRFSFQEQCEVRAGPASVATEIRFRLTFLRTRLQDNPHRNQVCKS